MAVRKSKGADPVDDLIDSAVKAVQGKFGKESVTRLNNSSDLATIKSHTSFGHWGLDRITGGGAPAGRLVELYGANSVGKSFLIDALLANCQAQGGIAILDDMEHAYDRFFGEIAGVDNDRLIYMASETVEEFWDRMECTLVSILTKNPNAYILYAGDSIAQVPSKEEKNTDLDDVGGFRTEKATAITIGARKTTSLIGKHNVALVIVNQLKHKVGVMFGSDEYCAGGDALGFWASIRLRLSIIDMIRGNFDDEDMTAAEELEEDKKKDKKKGAPKKDSPIIGVRGKAIAKKNKIVKPFQETEFDLYFDKGLDYTSGCFDLLRKDGIVSPGCNKDGEMTKGWYLYDGANWRKKELEQHFREHPDLLKQYSNLR